MYVRICIKTIVVNSVRFTPAISAGRSKTIPFYLTIGQDIRRLIMLLLFEAFKKKSHLLPSSSELSKTSVSHIRDTRDLTSPSDTHFNRITLPTGMLETDIIPLNA